MGCTIMTRISRITVITQTHTQTPTNADTGTHTQTHTRLLTVANNRNADANGRQRLLTVATSANMANGF
jgi:hypothetical protein